MTEPEIIDSSAAGEKNENSQTPVQKLTLLERLHTQHSFSVVRRIEELFAHMSISERALTFLCAIVLIVSVFGMLKTLNYEITTEVPARGGSISEGVVGSPRFINPVLAVSETDRALTSLLYAGLTRMSSDDTIVPELAESYEVDESGLVYTFYLRQNAKFHDGTPVTADDVLFTIQKCRDPLIKSPRRADWEGVTVEKVNDYTITFTLDKPYALFLFNTSLGILPKHVWKDLSPEEFTFSANNLSGIGAGPYVYDSIMYSSDGIPDTYRMYSYKEYVLGEVYISSFIFNFYRTDADLVKAFSSASIAGFGGISPVMQKEVSITPSYIEHDITLPRIFALFFNQGKESPLSNIEVRRALAEVVNREPIINDVLHGYGTPLAGPLPSIQSQGVFSTTSYEKAAEILDAAGWKVSEETSIRSKDGTELTLSIATANTEELKAAARLIAEQWRSLGVKVKVELYDTGDLNINVVRPRNFDVLLFGEVTGRTPDLFAFWHSSQKNDPGLNITQYQNKKADQLLEKTRSSIDLKERFSLNSELSNVVTNDIPAIFLYAPQYIYILPTYVHGVTFPQVMEAHERFNDVRNWYIEYDRVWNFFVF
jgi:peptide/nickel transport system substrate-binding protein